VTEYERRALERAIEDRIQSIRSRGALRHTPYNPLDPAHLEHADFRDLSAVLDRLRRGEAL
jgi:hypothetical protein